MLGNETNVTCDSLTLVDNASAGGFYILKINSRGRSNTSSQT
jgi:hypothetical protein